MDTKRIKPRGQVQAEILGQKLYITNMPLAFFCFAVFALLSCAKKPPLAQGNLPQDGFVEVISSISQFEDICREKYSKENYCQIGVGVANSESIASQIAILNAKNYLASYIKTNVQMTDNIINSYAESELTGTRSHTKHFKAQDINDRKRIMTEEMKYCAKGSNKKSETEDFAEYYTLNGNEVIGVCIISMNELNGFSMNIIKIGEAPEIRVQKTHTQYHAETMQYTIYALVTLPLKFSP